MSEYWKKFYKKAHDWKQSSFAEFCLPYLKGRLTELGCGDGRDLRYFSKNGITVLGVDEATENELSIKMDIATHIALFPSPDFVYTRFVWHSILRGLQLDILKWAKKTIFIEARTTKDKEYRKAFGKNHYRNYVDVKRLLKDLSDNGFTIDYITEGTGLSIYKKEDPHLVRIIATKKA